MSKGKREKTTVSYLDSGNELPNFGHWLASTYLSSAGYVCCLLFFAVRMALEKIGGKTKNWMPNRIAISCYGFLAGALCDFENVRQLFDTGRTSGGFALARSTIQILQCFRWIFVRSVGRCTRITSGLTKQIWKYFFLITTLEHNCARIQSNVWMIN